MGKRKMSTRDIATEKVVTQRLEGALKSRGELKDDGTSIARAASASSSLNAWVESRLARQKSRDDLTMEEYQTLIRMALDQSRRNGAEAIPQPELAEAAARFRAMMSQRLGDNGDDRSVRGTFDPFVPDVGNLAAMGLIRESRHFLRKRYKDSSSAQVETVRRWWFEFCFEHARVSPIRPMPSRSIDAQMIEEDLWCNFAAWLARTKVGSTVTNYLSTLKRWHRTVTGWDPINSSDISFVMLTQILAGIRAELPSKERKRFAHPTRLFKEWWEPLTRVKRHGKSILDMEPIQCRTPEEWNNLSASIRSMVGEARMPKDDLRHLIMAAAMTAGLLRIGEAAAQPGGEQPQIMRSDVRFHWAEDGRLAYVTLDVSPLKKGRATRKRPVIISYSAGGKVRAAFWIWLLFLLDPVPDSKLSTTPLFRQWSWLGGKVPTHDEFRKWYQAKMKEAGVAHAGYYNTHSFRIGGATALCCAGIPLEQLKAMGRWDSDVALVYSRQTFEAMLRASRALDTVDATPFESQGDEFFDAIAGVSLEGADEMATALLETPELLEFEDDDA